MSLLASLNSTQDESIQTAKDSVGGGGFIWETNLYPCTIDIAYLEKKPSGALFLNVVLKNDDGGELREGLCIASGDAKGNKTYYENAQGERHFLPGFNHASDMSLLTLGKELNELSTEKRIIKVYNKDAGKELPTEVDMVTDLVGQRILAGIQKQIVDKTQQGGDGKYHPTGETREVNEIDKIFRERDSKTSFEVRTEAEEATFHATWKEKWAGKVRNKASAANDANGASQGAPRAAAGGSTKPKQSLFS